MKTERVAIDSVSLNPADTRRYPERSTEVMKASLRQYGQPKPVLIDRNNIVRAGAGTYAAAKALGWTEIIVIRSDLHGSEATAYSIADERTAELAEWNNPKLGPQLDQLKAAGIDPEELGFTAFDVAEINRIREGLNTPDRPKATAKQVTCPKCGIKFTAARNSKKNRLAAPR